MNDKEARAFVDKKGRIAIPAAFLKDLNISDGDQLIFRVDDDELRVTTMSSRIEGAQSRGSSCKSGTFARRGTNR